jgi:protein involved in polysaccharide export with SLBB domain
LVAAALLAVTVLAAAQEPVPSAVPAPSLIRNGLYVLQIGDDISIRVFKVPELDEAVKVRPDGKISVMLLSDIDAAGLTTRELGDVLLKRYAEFFKDPQVSVILKTFANLRVYVGGEVGQPGPVPLSGQMTVVGAVFHAGGLKNSARMDSVVLVRNDGHEQPSVRRINLKDVFAKGTPDIALQPFDVVYVPESRIRRVDRFVDEYIRQLIPITATAGFTYLLGNNGIVRIP